jgi:hypothetical protein
MNSTNTERTNLPIRGVLPAGNFNHVNNFRARWQTAVETVSAYEVQKLRLELAPSVSKLVTHLNAWDQ